MSVPIINVPQLTIKALGIVIAASEWHDARAQDHISIDRLSKAEGKLARAVQEFRAQEQKETPA